MSLRQPYPDHLREVRGGRARGGYLTSKGCAVDYNNVMWTCRGKGKCFNVPVEARALPDPSCGSAYTTCLKVEYDCVASKYILHDRKK